MHSRSRFGKVMLRFRRWSRNPYAAFCSLGKNVTIGVVCQGIADVSLKKASGVLDLAYSVDNFSIPDDDDGGSLPEHCPCNLVSVFFTGGKNGRFPLIRPYGMF